MIDDILEAVLNNGALANGDIPVTLVPPTSVATAKDLLYKAVMEVIGEDEENVMNRALQETQRQRVNKLFGRDK